MGLVDRAIVFVVSGDGTTQSRLHSNVRCRLVNSSSSLEAGGNPRAEMADWSKLLWEPGVEIPDDAQIEIKGIRYNMTAEGVETIRTGSGQPYLKRCRVVRAIE